MSALPLSFLKKKTVPTRCEWNKVKGLLPKINTRQLWEQLTPSDRSKSPETDGLHPRVLKEFAYVANLRAFENSWRTSEVHEEPLNQPYVPI